ncbi:MAG TPA: phosphatase PAP2 family protein [Roseiflexaceae bacterium]|nr:phosphatase PAP2 family protein [Roseiflexaceae bacterium]
MTDTERHPEPTPEERARAEPAKDALREALKAIKTPAQAERAAEAVQRAAGDVTERALREHEGAAPEPARAIEAAAAVPGPAKAPATLVEAARQVAHTEGGERAALEEALQEAVSPEVKSQADPATEEGRDLLREAILARMKPYHALDTRLFLAINHMPHPPLLNRAMYALTSLMNAGFGWVLLLVAAKLLRLRSARTAFYQALPPLWFATMSVEYPIKHYFRRRRPFYDIVEAIAVGKKPGGYSFPSGHSAAAFAGAWLVTRVFPRLAPLWYLIAALVGFSRVYLGAHYPGDVLSGALAGTTIAEVARRVIDAGDEC